jgi:hypothetical protein
MDVPNIRIRTMDNRHYGSIQEAMDVNWNDALYWIYGVHIVCTSRNIDSLWVGCSTGWIWNVRHIFDKTKERYFLARSKWICLDHTWIVAV